MEMYEGFDEEARNNNTQLRATKIRSYEGKTFYFCKQCMTSVHVAEEVKGITRESDYNIYWHYVTGVCGHTIKEMSY